MLIRLDLIDDEIFVDLFLSRKELMKLVQCELVEREKNADGRIIKVSICAPMYGEIFDEEEDERKPEGES